MRKQNTIQIELYFIQNNQEFENSIVNSIVWSNLVSYPNTDTGL